VREQEEGAGGGRRSPIACVIQPACCLFHIVVRKDWPLAA